MSEAVLSLVQLQIELGNDPPERGAGFLLMGQCLGDIDQSTLQLGVLIHKFLHRGGR
ncbi:hypothetical protein AB0E06_21285 [Streptomyces sp. NPDC048109]|uniref:hypothetical protein n=1 Tax=unclassified Streptomyces TaxID=2593676 RepID=UPI0033E530F4